MLWYISNYSGDVVHQVVLRHSREDWLAVVELSNDAADAPHVHCMAVDLAEHDLWCSIVPRAHIQEALLSFTACRPQVNDFYILPILRGENDVLWLEITVRHTGLLEMVRPLDDLTGNVLDAIHAFESCWVLFELLVEVVAEHFENEAEMLPESKPVLEPDDSVIVRTLYLVHKF